MKMEYEDIKQIIASVGGYFGSSYKVEVEFVNGKISYEESGMGIIEPPTIVMPMDNEDIDMPMDNEGIAKFREELVKCRILDWDNEYIEPNALDGTHWSLDIELEDKVLHIHGSNAYPNEWKRFCKAIRKLTGKPFE